MINLLEGFMAFRTLDKILIDSASGQSRLKHVQFYSKDGGETDSQDRADLSDMVNFKTVTEGKKNSHSKNRNLSLPYPQKS